MFLLATIRYIQYNLATIIDFFTFHFYNLRTETLFYFSHENMKGYFNFLEIFSAALTAQKPQHSTFTRSIWVFGVLYIYVFFLSFRVCNARIADIMHTRNAPKKFQEIVLEKLHWWVILMQFTLLVFTIFFLWINKKSSVSKISKSLSRRHKFNIVLKFL